MLDEIAGEIYNYQSKIDEGENNDEYQQYLKKMMEKKIFIICWMIIFRGMPLLKAAEEYFRGHFELVGESLISYMQIICSKLSELLKKV